MSANRPKILETARCRCGLIASTQGMVMGGVVHVRPPTTPLNPPLVPFKSQPWLHT